MQPDRAAMEAQVMAIGRRRYTVAQTAALWGVSTTHVYTLIERGALGHLRIGAAIRIRQADIDAYEARQWRAPVSTDQTSASDSEGIGSMSRGGQTAASSAFRRGQQTNRLRSVS